MPTRKAMHYSVQETSTSTSTWVCNLRVLGRHHQALRGTAVCRVQGQPPALELARASILGRLIAPSSPAASGRVVGEGVVVGGAS
mmetsp:Transcript_15711/g.38241  ORF Transcript_15711/g.38241 Transcript_15711/m.38241 type:complete len:85 (-) Transcript_15711:46-300(-)